VTLAQMLAKRETVSVADAPTILLPLYMNSHMWNVDDTINDVRRRKQKYILEDIIISGVQGEIIEGSLHYDYIYDADGLPEQYEPDGHSEKVLYSASSYVNLKSLIERVVKDIKDTASIPVEYLAIAGLAAEVQIGHQAQVKSTAGSAAELGSLRTEKEKWDASIVAATEIGLLFYEGGLTKPTTRDAFMEEFRDKVGGLPDTTIEKIYKALPPEYRHKGGKPKKPSNGASYGDDGLWVVIKAAVYAGSIFDTNDGKDIRKLAASLLDNDYKVPSEEILKKIVDAVRAI
jgi:hypothetical protein